MYACLVHVCHLPHNLCDFHIYIYVYIHLHTQTNKQTRIHDRTSAEDVEVRSPREGLDLDLADAGLCSLGHELVLRLLLLRVECDQLHDCVLECTTDRVLVKYMCVCT